ncbi:dynein heavy chain [Achlya hypogyna]|uniref:Dynein heavy chain n=1 Tax=Achlya hypogyna TaxID=1202772 RepID=A0A1V9YGX8_ACHHY|nr:dynein heavy chain [Achlya hypogyna]
MDEPELNAPPQLEWAKVLCTGDAPSRRSGHSLTIVGSNGFLFGGCDYSDPPGPTNDLFQLRINANGSCEWSRILFRKGPSARWKHSATNVDNKIFVFGGFQSATTRFQDLWVFNPITMEWSQPVPQASPRNSKAASATFGWPNCPPPRGGHSACLIDREIYVFGGYGGQGYSRRDFDDLYSLNVDDMTWLKVTVKGKIPEKRSGHQTCAVDTKMFVFGGWNCSMQFNDLYIFDTETSAWSSVEGQHMSHPSPRWNHSSCAVLAIPSAKIFCFGGVLGTINEYGSPGTFANDISVLDSGSLVWSVPAIQGTPPAPRSDTTLAYDDKGSRLLICGGWANFWFNDVFALDVSSVVGPPYAITGIFPSFGAITGGTLLTIEGIDFVPKAVIVRFSCRKGTLDVSGTYVNEQTLTVVTPDYSNFPPGDVQVRVALQGDSFTTTSQTFNFFAVTSASTTLAYGPGVLSGAATAEPVVFLLQACDGAGNFRSRGGDEFAVTVRCLADDKDIPTEIQDLENGTYLITYVAPVRGEYEVAVEFLGTFGGVQGVLYGFPVVVNFEDNVSRDVNRMTGKLLLDNLAMEMAALTTLMAECSRGLHVELSGTLSSADDTHALIQLKEQLFTIEKKGTETRWRLAKVRSMLSYLGTTMDVERDRITLLDLEQTWADLLLKVPMVAGKIAPRLQAQASRTKGDIQAYHATLLTYHEGFKALDFWQFTTGVKPALRQLDDVAGAFGNEEAKYNQVRHVAEIFECLPLMEPSERVINQIARSLDRLRSVWLCVDDVGRKLSFVKDLLWADLDGAMLEEEAKGLMAGVKSVVKEREIKESSVYQGLEAMTRDFLVSCPLYQALRHPSMQSRHWVELMGVLHKSFPDPMETPDLKFGDIMALSLHAHAKDIEDLTDRAQKEMRIEVALADVDARWGAIAFEITTYKDTSVPLLRVRDEDMEILEADQVAVQAMLSGRVAFYRAASEAWAQKLSAIADVTSALGEIQRTWSYLEPLFIGSEEVKRELPKDAEQFAGVDIAVKAVLTAMADARIVLAACTERPTQVEELHALFATLQACQTSLIEFLDGKRRLFPRFYFTSEADLLDILSTGSRPVAIMKHLTKVFLATETFIFEDDAAVQFVASVGKETIRFQSPLLLVGKVESYLKDAHEAMQATLLDSIKGAVKRYPTLNRIEWLSARTPDGAFLDPAQVVLLVAGIEYVKQVEIALQAMQKAHETALVELLEVVTIQLQELIKLTRTALSDDARMRIMCLITLDAHARDIVQSMVAQRVNSVSSFVWQAQLKPRLLLEQTPTLDICDASFEYGLEYLGNGPRLVITPLTDRMYVTATQALHLHMGCAPAGPAGTGKTETTKDLASALGKACYVFNCSPEMDYKSLGNIFKGLASSGAWGCFDEFNRLIPEVLSVCCVQFKAVCDGIKGALPTIVLEGDTVSLDPTCGTFITMNPGYLGRSELPEGLKALFRPITVMMPDLLLICENMLMAQGFTQAKMLASKFYHLYELCKELLSQQEHYDWGLRAIKSILVVTGALKRSEPTLGEPQLLLRALRDFNLPKLVQADEPIFHGLLTDLFPEDHPPRHVDAALEKHIEASCEALGLWPDPAFRLKVVQLDELLALRHCVFVIGAAGAGKSECITTLQYAGGLRGTKVKMVDLNPKVVSTEELYGYMHVSTREWRDGLLSKLLRDLANDDGDYWKWLVLDGDLDANWIESMNSVMDDNKMLTLASNERIPLKKYMRLLFEIRDLTYATPATVSRAGILYLSSDDGMQYRAFIASWLNDASPELDVRGRLGEVVLRYVEPCLACVRRLPSVVPRPDLAAVQALLYFLDATLDAAVVADMKRIEIVCGFASIWAFGGSLPTAADDGTDARKLFSDWWRAEFKSVKVPIRDTVFDYYLNPQTLVFESWKSCSWYAASVKYDASVPMANLTIPTAETTSVLYWSNKMVGETHGVMLAGGAGTGKTQLIQGFLEASLGLTNAHGKSYLSSRVNFNFYTNAPVLQSILESKLTKRMGSTYGPTAAGSQWIYFLDDLNLPMVDAYNTQSALALLRQLIDYEHWYDRSKFTLKHLVDCQFVACMNPGAGSFCINPRLQRHFVTFAIALPSPTSLVTIYQTFLDGHLSDFNDDVRRLSSSLLKAAFALHSQVATTFRKTAANFHYEFNLRHLSSVFQGILLSKPATFEDPAKMVLLWIHESARVYSDRLVSQADVTKYTNILQNHAKKSFPSISLQKYFATEHADPILFCPSATDGPDVDYEQITTYMELKQKAEDALTEYNAVLPKMDLVLFKDALEHVARVVRIIANGHALLVGVGGSGRKSLARLSAYMAMYSTVDITLTQSYSLLDFKTDLQSVFSRAGLKGEKVVFLLSDADIKQDRMLVYINDLLSSGMIPDLYTVEEQDALVSQVATKLKGDKDACWSYFQEQIRRNVHCVLCFSPVDGRLRQWSRKFPALVNCTGIDWFQAWPLEALQSVAVRSLSSTTLHGDPLAAVEAFMPHAFMSVNNVAIAFKTEEHRDVYTTPKTYLECLAYFNELLVAKQQAKSKDIFRLQSGLDKMEATSHVVANIEDELKTMLAEAMEKKVIAEEMATAVAADKIVVESETQKANVEAAKCQLMHDEMSVKKADTEKDLEAALPMIEAAMAALDTLNRKDLGNCKTMSKPPAGVGDIFASVMVLFAGINPEIPVQKNGKLKEKDRSWESAKKILLGNVNGLIDDLKNFKNLVDTYAVPDTNWKEIRPLLELPHFNVDVIEKKNSAAAGLCAWVINIVAYYDVLVTVEPKRQALKLCTEVWQAANDKLEAVRQLTDRLAKLTAEYERTMADVDFAIATVEKGKVRMSLARRLTAALGSENTRWAVNVAALQAEAETIVGDVLLAATFVAYAGPFTKPYRDLLLMTHWRPFIVNFKKPLQLRADPSPVSLLAPPTDIATWIGAGLPSDAVSIENGAIVHCCKRWPLLVDPQLQAIHWLRSKDREKLVFVRRYAVNLLTTLETAIEQGSALLIEAMDESVDPVLWPVISRCTVVKGRKTCLKLGDKLLEWAPSFRLYLHTTLSNPHYPPEVQAETTMVNFAVTPQGLEDQLLALVVRKEWPKKARARTALMLQQTQFKVKMLALEDKILSSLADAEGEVTENVELISDLEATKATADAVATQSQAAQANEAEIAALSRKYTSVAARGAMLFFVLNNLHKLHTYYVFSLNAFVVMFQRGMDTAKGGGLDADDPKKATPSALSRFKLAAKRVIGSQRFLWDTDVLLEDRVLEATTDLDFVIASAKDDVPGDDASIATRCGHLETAITQVVFDYVRRGLLEKDKLLLAAQLCFAVLKQAGTVTPAELTFLTTAPAMEDTSMGMGLLNEWLTEPQWQRVRKIEELPGFQLLPNEMKADAEEWKEWFYTDAPETHDMPGKKRTKLAQLLLVRILRPDRFLTALTAFISEHLGQYFVQQPPFDLEAIYQEGSASTPILFMLFPGVDPTVAIEQLGRKLQMTTERGNFRHISMGQGQEGPAEAALTAFAAAGSWLVLQNIHLMPRWLPVLTRLLDTCTKTADPNFRCFLSAEAPPIATMTNMPESLLQSCIKIANEAPMDMRSNLSRAWAAFNLKVIETSLKPNEFQGCLFALCFYHAVVLGRRRFGAQGWSRPYSFNQGDLTLCADVLRRYTDKALESALPWEDLRYIFGDIMYGGHITDFWDRLTNRTYLASLFTEDALRGKDIMPGFAPPDPYLYTYSKYATFIDKELPTETPVLFGLHPNTEIQTMTTACQDLLFQLQVVGGALLGIASAVQSSSAPAASSLALVQSLTQRLPENFDLVDLKEQAQPLLEQSHPMAPYVVVALQECTRMNTLLSVMRRSLSELTKGLNGLLNMSEPMEEIMEAISLQQVPGRNPLHTCSWERYAYPSRKSLTAWYADLLDRVSFLAKWVLDSSWDVPTSMWLSGLFNPASFLTAVKQVTARATQLPLDNMTIETHVVANAVHGAGKGAFVHGLFLEGARWCIPEDGDADAYVVDDVPCAGFVAEAKPKEVLHCMPTLYIRAVPINEDWEATAVGHFRKDPSTYECPVYVTSQRGPTYIFFATMNTKLSKAKWIMAGVALLLQKDG